MIKRSQVQCPAAYHQVTTLGKWLTPMCLCSPSSIIWYFVRASCLMRHHVAAIHGSSEQGKYCSSGFAAFFWLNRDINYLLYFTSLLFMLVSSTVVSIMQQSGDWPSVSLSYS